MKRWSMMKLLMLVVGVMIFVTLKADIADLPPHVMSSAEWTVAMRRYSILWRLAIPCSAVGIFLAALISSVRLKRPSMMVWLACCSPVAFLAPMIYHESLFLDFFFAILGVSAVSGIFSVVHYFYVRKFVKAVLMMVALPCLFIALLFLGVARSDFLQLSASGSVETKSGETYEEYRKRADRIVFHYCPECDKPMKEYGNNYWLCPDCCRGIMCCTVCGAKKDLVQKGLHWQEGYKWQCPNCDKDTDQRQCSPSLP